MSASIVSGILIVTYTALSIIATRMIRRSALLSPAHKKRQLMVTWLVPVAGAAILIVFNKKDKPSGSHENRVESWKRLVKYDEHGEC